MESAKTLFSSGHNKDNENIIWWLVGFTALVAISLLNLKKLNKKYIFKQFHSIDTDIAWQHISCVY